MPNKQTWRIAADVTSTAQANAAITVQAQVLATKEALVVETSVAIRATASAVPLSANAIAVGNKDRVTTLRTLQGHTDHVYGIAFSLDGQLLASASLDHTAKIWRVSDGSVVQTIQSESAVYRVAFSPDSKTLAIATDNGTELWNVADGLLLRSFAKSLSYAVAFSADGLTVASGSYDGPVTLWRVIDGSPLFTLTGHTNYVLNVAFSPDQTIIAAGANDNTIRLWRASDGTPLKTLIGSNKIQDIAFAPDGQTIAASSGDDSIKLWRVSDGALLNNASNVPTIGVTFSPDGQLFVAAGSWVKSCTGVESIGWRGGRLPRGSYSRGELCAILARRLYTRVLFRRRHNQAVGCIAEAIIQHFRNPGIFIPRPLREVAL